VHAERGQLCHARHLRHACCCGLVVGQRLDGGAPQQPALSFHDCKEGHLRLELLRAAGHQHAGRLQWGQQLLDAGQVLRVWQRGGAWAAAPRGLPGASGKGGASSWCPCTSRPRAWCPPFPPPVPTKVSFLPHHFHPHYDLPAAWRGGCPRNSRLRSWCPHRRASRAPAAGRRPRARPPGGQERRPGCEGEQGSSSRTAAPT
jgi:hypothetical protein